MKNRNDQLRDMIAAEAAERLLAREEQSGDSDLLAWFRNSPIHIAEYLGMAKLSSDLSLVTKEIDYPLEKLVTDAREDSNIVGMSAGDLRGQKLGATSVVRPYLVHTALGLAVASVIALGISLTWIGPNRGLRYTTGHGEESTIRLTDGTFVHLNTDSALDVKFEQNVRLVELERGEAYFEVARVSDRPFRVRVGATEFQDMGTAFNVFRGNASSEVTVAEGRVSIFKMGASESVLNNGSTRLADLTAGQQATVSASGAITAETTPNLDQVLAWTHQQIVFDKESIRDVAAQFNRYNDVPIIVSDVRTANIAISGNFHVRDQRAFVAFLNRLPGVRTTASGRMIDVLAKPR